MEAIQVSSGTRVTATLDHIAENEGAREVLAAVSCALPPVTEIAGRSFRELDGIGT